MPLLQSFRQNALLVVGLYETCAGTIGIALIVYALMTTTDLFTLNAVSLLLTTFSPVTVVAGILVLRRSVIGFYLSVLLQALQVVQLAMPGFFLSFMCGLKLRLLVLPRLGPEIGLDWGTALGIGIPADVFVAVNAIPVALLYLLFNARQAVQPHCVGRIENAA